MKTKIIGIFSILALSINIYSFVWVNDVDCAFSYNADQAVLKQKVVEGSIYVLEAKAYTDHFLSEYERAAVGSFNVAEALSYFEHSISEMEFAKKKFEEALNIGAILTYKTSNLEKFNSFDYDGYIKNINNLNKILDFQYKEKEELKNNNTPEITLVWGLMNQFSESALFGSYTSMLSIKILGNCGGNEK